MTRLRFDQLPASARAQIERGEATVVGSSRRPPRSRRQATDRGLPLTCGMCGDVIDKPSESSLARHTAEHGHAVRYEWRADERII